MPLPSMHYEYMERKTAKVSSDFHVRFDNAYYSVDKAFLHKKVSIKASSTVVRIYSLAGEFLCEWPRATRKGQWSTNPDHLPDNYKGFTQWNAPYFIQKAQLIGKNTEAVIRTILKSRPYEVQTYRMCLGILNFTKKYSNKALEECCYTEKIVIPNSLPEPNLLRTSFQEFGIIFLSLAVFPMQKCFEYH